MPFRVYCDNKGCGKDNEPLLNVETNEAECTECGKVINNITSFAKTQMKALGQIKRGIKKQAFAVECKYCKKFARPKIENNSAVCSFCNATLEYISSAFISMLKEHLKSFKE